MTAASQSIGLYNDDSYRSNFTSYDNDSYKPPTPSLEAEATVATVNRQLFHRLSWCSRTDFVYKE